MHAWHLPRILGQSTCSLFQYPACREHDWKVTWSFERRRRINWFLMIGLWALVASQNSLALEAPSNLVSEWKTEPFRNMTKLWCPYVFRTSVHCGIFRILHECICCYSEPPCEHMNPPPSSTKQLTVACWRKAKWLRIWCLRPVLIRTTSKVKADPW